MLVCVHVVHAMHVFYHNKGTQQHSVWDSISKSASLCLVRENGTAVVLISSS